MCERIIAIGESINGTNTVQTSAETSETTDNVNAFPASFVCLLSGVM